MAKGGKREGAGRKKGYVAIEAEKARAYIVQRVSEELAPIMDKLIEKAKAGDNKSAEYLLNQAYGKPKESFEHTGVEFEFLKKD